MVVSRLYYSCIPGFISGASYCICVSAPHLRYAVSDPEAKYSGDAEILGSMPTLKIALASDHRGFVI